MIAARVLCVLLLLPALAGPAAAGGSGDADEQGDFPHFFGFVRDADGKPVADARVNATLKAGGAALVTRSDATGAYQIPMFNDTNPDQATITCSKEGYRFKEVQRRNPGAAAGSSVEVDCVVAHE